ncbi:MAG: amidase family protein, partial [Patescibacteria group bacterium]
RASLSGDVSDITIGLPKEFFANGLTAEVEQLVQAAVTVLERLGATVREVSLPHSQQSIAVYYVITPSEISANLARYDGIRFGHHSDAADNLFELYSQTRGEGFGPEAKRRIMLGTYALSAGYYDAYYLQAQKVRTVITREVDRVLSEVDLLLTPTAPHVAFPLGEKVNDPLAMYLEDIYMGLASIAGLPAISLPVGFAGHLPVGLQLIGRRLREDIILRVADAYQRVSEWHLERPQL